MAKKPSKKKRQDLHNALEKITPDDRGVIWVNGKISDFHKKGKPLFIGKPDGHERKHKNGKLCKKCDHNLESIALKERMERGENRFPPGAERATLIVRWMRSKRLLEVTKEKDEYGIPKLADGTLKPASKLPLHGRSIWINDRLLNIKEAWGRFDTDNEAKFDLARFHEYVTLKIQLLVFRAEVHMNLDPVLVDSLLDVIEPKSKQLGKIKSNQEKRFFNKTTPEGETDFDLAVEEVERRLRSPKSVITGSKPDDEWQRGDELFSSLGLTD